MAIREQLLPFVRQRRQSLSVQFLVYVFAVALFPGLARCAVDNNDSTTPLHILYITSSGGGYDSSGTRPAVDMAIERINNDTAVLPEYTLDIIEADSQCTRKGALDSFFTQLFVSPRVVAAVGAGCSIASEALAEVAHYYNFSVVSYASSSEALSDRQRFSSFFRTVPSESWAMLGVTTVIEEFGWTRAAIITQDEISFKSASDDLFVKLQERNISIVSRVILPTNLSLYPDPELFAPDVRIFVLQMYSSYARTVICKFINQELDQYQYVWIIPGWYPDQWWTDEKATFTVNCTDEKLAGFLHQQRVLTVRVVTSDLSGNEDAIGGLTPDEFKREYKTRVESTGQEYAPNAYHAYDAVWAVALALHNYADQQLLASGSGGQTCNGIRRLEDFATEDNSREQTCIWEAIQSNLERVEFTGVSGYVMFEDGSRVPERLKVLQYRQDTDDNDNITLTDIATIYLGENFSFQYANNENISTVWPMDVPHDGTPIEQDNYPLLGLTVFCYTFATAGSIFAAVCMVFTVIFRNRKLIRLTSPNLNYVIGFGVIIFNTAVYFFVFPEVPDTTLLVFCNIRPWFASLGYSLCFGTINAKMWRVFYIFHNPKPAKRKKVLKDWHLFVIVMIFVLVDVIILTVVSALDGVRFDLDRVGDNEFPSRPNDDGITVIYFVTLCNSRWRTVWLGILFGYKVIVQIIGVFLAFRIRKVTIKMLNDSKEISATLYLSSIILAIVILISFIWPNNLNAYGASFAIGIPTSSTVVLLVVFVSKMVRLYRDPKGEYIFGKTNATTGMAGTNLNDPEKVTTLEKKVRDLKSQLSRYEASTLRTPTHIGRSISTTEINGKSHMLRFNSEDILGNNTNLNNSQSIPNLA